MVPRTMPCPSDREFRIAKENLETLTQLLHCLVELRYEDIEGIVQDHVFVIRFQNYIS